MTGWKERPEGGSRFALRLLCWVARHGGRPGSRLLLYPITLYFLLVRGPERRASRAYLERVLARPVGWLDVARHIHCFASTILDRVFLLSGRLDDFDVRISGLDVLHQQMDRGKGVLLFGSHLGSFEVLRVLSRKRPDVSLRVVMDRAQNAATTELLEALDPAIAATVIDAGQDGTAIVLAIREAAEASALIGLLVDRARPGEPARSIPFLGAPAPFPNAPFLIAAALSVPVVLSFGLYRGGRRYDLHFELFDPSPCLPRPGRAAALEAMQRRYVERLQHYVRMAPYNWFNFYDFWNAEDLPPGHRDGTAGAGAVGLRPRSGGGHEP